MARIGIRLTYFSKSGKYYSEGGDYIVEQELFHQHIEDIKDLQETGNLPGLVKGVGKEFIILIEVPQIRRYKIVYLPHILPAME